MTFYSEFCMKVTKFKRKHIDMTDNTDTSLQLVEQYLNIPSKANLPSQSYFWHVQGYEECA